MTSFVRTAAAALAVVLFATLVPAASEAAPRITLEKTVRHRKIIWPKSINLDPTGRYAVANNLEGMNSTVIDTNTREVVKVIEHKFNLETLSEGRKRHQGKPVEVAFTANGRYAWFSYYRIVGPGFPASANDKCTTTHDSRVGVYDMQEDKFVALITVGAVPKVLVASPDDRYVYVNTWCGFSTEIIDTQTYQVVKKIPVGRKPRGMVFTNDGRYAYLTIMGGSMIKKIDTARQKVVKEIVGTGPAPRHLVISPDGRTIYVTINLEHKIKKLDVATDRVSGGVYVGKRPRSMTISPDGKYIYAVIYDEDRVVAVETETMTVVGSARTGTKPIGADMKRNQWLWVSNYADYSVNLYKIEGVDPTPEPAAPPAPTPEAAPESAPGPSTGTTE